MSRIGNFWKTTNDSDKETRSGCCGCGTCAVKCPHNAICMRYDSEGFLYPYVDEKLCVGCGLCKKVCPVLNVPKTENDDLSVYAGYSTNPDILENCTSGGFATALSLYVVKQQGVVFGVGYDEDYIKCRYSSAETAEELKHFMGSKYVQSEKNQVFQKVREELQKNRLVLFVGCPCDISAIKLFLGKEYGNLLTCELVCMGVTSHKVAEQYKSYTEGRNRSKLVFINARSKKRGWFVPHLEEKFDNGKSKTSTLFGTYYGYGFQIFNRPSCFSCSYRGKVGCADFRVGDFWGVKDTDAFWNEKGVSCILVRTARGESILEELKKMDFQLFPTDYETATKNNMSSHSNKPEKYVELREKFSQVFREKGMISACRATSSAAFWVKHFVPEYLHVFLKKTYHMLIDKR